MATITVGNQKFTLSASESSGCLARSGLLHTQLSAPARAGSSAGPLRFARALFFVDRGVRHVHRRVVHRHGKRVTVTTVTHSANRTVSSLPATVSFKLAGLASGLHTLGVKVVLHRTVRRHRHHVTISVPER